MDEWESNYSQGDAIARWLAAGELFVLIGRMPLMAFASRNSGAPTNFSLVTC